MLSLVRLLPLLISLCIGWGTHLFIYLFIYLFLFIYFWSEGKRGRKRGEKRQCARETSIGFLQPGTWPATQACALARNQTSNLLLYGMMPSQLSHTGQGLGNTFKIHLRLYDLGFLCVQGLTCSLCITLDMCTPSRSPRIYESLSRSTMAVLFLGAHCYIFGRSVACPNWCCRLSQL